MVSRIKQLRQSAHFDRLDVGVGLAVGVLLLAIAVTLIGGDRVGAGVTAVYPEAEAHTTTPIRVTFDEAMDTQSVEDRFSIDPPVAGKFSWSGNQLTFKPSAALAADQTYTVTIRTGAINGRRQRLLLQDMRWSFHVRRPRVLYLAPAVAESQSLPPNLWMVDPAQPSGAAQLTFSQAGLLDFAPGPDGTQVAYSEQVGKDGGDLYILRLDTGAVQQITNCANARCQSPAWSPDGTRIAYERIELGPEVPSSGQGQTRTWIVNLRDLSTAPLIKESQFLGALPQWSPDGTEIAVYDQNRHVIAIYNLATGESKIIPTLVEDPGLFDPSGKRLVYAVLTEAPQEFYNTFALADLAGPKGGVRPLNDPDGAAVDDHQAAWNPDGKSLAVTRRYLDARPPCGAQVYLVNPDTGGAQPLVVEGSYSHGAIGWNPAGDQLVMQRFPCLEPNAQPSIWVYDMTGKAFRQVAQNGYIPEWLP